jgi:hypothetical protein
MKHQQNLPGTLSKAVLALGLGCTAIAVSAPQQASAHTLVASLQLARLAELADGLQAGGNADAAVPAMKIGLPTKLAGLWYRVTDEFEEKCGESSLRIETGSNNHFTPITRGDPDYLTPYNDPNDAFGGRFDWKCGSSLEHSECSDSPNGADYIRVAWSRTGRNIAIKCFERCGDGSAEGDCL